MKFYKVAIVFDSLMALALGQLVSNSQQTNELNDASAATQPQDSVQPFAPTEPLASGQLITRPVPIIQPQDQSEASIVDSDSQTQPETLDSNSDAQPLPPIKPIDPSWLRQPQAQSGTANNSLVQQQQQNQDNSNGTNPSVRPQSQHEISSAVPNLHSSNSSSQDDITVMVVGGKEVNPPFKYGFQVSLQDSKFPFCGGTLYKDNIVITAAHCSPSGEGSGLNGIEAVIHRHNITKTDGEENGKRFKVIKIINHPKYNSSNFNNDIAIWKLETYSSKRTNIALDSKNIASNTGQVLIATGFGTTSSGGPDSELLQEVNVPIYDIKKCNADYKGKVNAKVNVCAGYEKGGKDTCQGDSGGPLFVKNYNRYILVGITSWGEGCASPNKPGVYTRIKSYIDWINKNI